MSTEAFLFNWVDPMMFSTMGSELDVIVDLWDVHWRKYKQMFARIEEPQFHIKRAHWFRNSELAFPTHRWHHLHAENMPGNYWIFLTIARSK